MKQDVECLTENVDKMLIEMANMKQKILEGQNKRSSYKCNGYANDIARAHIEMQV